MFIHAGRYVIFNVETGKKLGTFDNEQEKSIYHYIECVSRMKGKLSDIYIIDSNYAFEPMPILVWKYFIYKE